MDRGLSLESITVNRRKLPVLRDLNLRVAPGQVIAICGPSGSGKSTLLHCIAGLLKPESGSIIAGEFDVTGARSKAARDWRLRHCGLVFQFSELLPELTLAENAELPLRLLGVSAASRETRVRPLMTRAGVEGVADALPNTVSGGQMQRAAIVRALATSPQVLLADEPTGALDASASETVLSMMIELAREQGSAVVIVTHDRAVAKMADDVYELRDGTLAPSHSSSMS